jgi:hypothetical protein
MSKPSKKMRLATRVLVGGSQLVAGAVCLSVALSGVWVGWVGATSTFVVGAILFFAPDVETT